MENSWLLIGPSNRLLQSTGQQTYIRVYCVFGRAMHEALNKNKKGESLDFTMHFLLRILKEIENIVA